jgi:drug/metabolite transporter (DMT)-like permease
MKGYEMENKKNIFQNPIVVSLLAIFCCALWGSATPAIKIGSSLLIPEPSTASTILFAGVRFAFAGLLTVIIYSIARRRVLIPKKQNVGRILLVSAFQTVIQYIFFYVGLNNTSGVKGTVLSGTSAFFAVLISALIFRLEKLTAKKIVACVLGFAGIIIVNVKDLDFNMNFTGDAFVIFSAIAVATSSVLMKVFSKHEDPVVISGYQFIVGGIVMIGIGLAFGGRIAIQSFTAFLILLYLSALSAVAYALWGMLLKFNPVSRVTIFSFMTPVFGTILSLIFLSENTKVSILNLIIALALVAGGVLLLNFVKKSNTIPEIKNENKKG